MERMATLLPSLISRIHSVSDSSGSIQFRSSAAIVNDINTSSLTNLFLYEQRADLFSIIMVCKDCKISISKSDINPYMSPNLSSSSRIAAFLNYILVDVRNTSCH